MEAIDLWHLADVISAPAGVSCTSSAKYDGPYLMAFETCRSIRPYGFLLQKVGTVEAGVTEITLTFEESSSSAVTSTLIFE